MCWMNERYSCTVYHTTPSLPFKASLYLITFHGFRDFQTKRLTRQVRDCRHPDWDARSPLSSTWRSATHLLRQQEMHSPDLNLPWLDPTVERPLPVGASGPIRRTFPSNPAHQLNPKLFYSASGILLQ